MAGKIVLVGGDEFRAKCVGMDAEILAATGVDTPHVVVVPTAAAMERPRLAADNGARHFSALGADAEPLMVLGANDANNAALIAAADEADVIYLTGGDPVHLIGALSGSRLEAALWAALNRGAIVVGSSAGAMALGEQMWFDREWIDGLGLAHKVVVLPHHEKKIPERVVLELKRGELHPDFVALGIDGATGCISERNGWRVLGAGVVTRYRDLRAVVDKRWPGEFSDVHTKYRLDLGKRFGAGDVFEV